MSASPAGSSGLVASALALVTTLLVAGCASPSAPEADAAAAADPSRPRGPSSAQGLPSPSPRDPAASPAANALNGSYRPLLLRSDGAGAAMVLDLEVASLAKNGEVEAILDVQLLDTDNLDAWGYQVFQLRDGVWVPLGFHEEATTVARKWTEGAADEETWRIEPGRRMFPMHWGGFAHQETLAYRGGLDPDGREIVAAPEDRYAVVVGAVGDFRALMRVGSQDELRFEEDGQGYGLGLGCYPSRLQRLGWASSIYDGCPPSNATVLDVPLQGARHPGFRFGMRHERTSAGLAFDVTSGTMQVEDGSPLGHRAGTATRHASYAMPPAFGAGWGFDLAYLIDTNSAGRWEHRVDVYNVSSAGMGPMAGGPSPFLYLASDLLVGGPIWSCWGEGAGEGSSSLAIDNVGSPATGGLDMLLYARADFGVPVGEMLGAPVQSWCFDLGLLYVLEVAGIERPFPHR